MRSSYLALTPGEPAGIGPDLVVQLAAQGRLNNVVVFADKNLLKERAQQLHLNLNCVDYQPESISPTNDALHIWHIPLAEACIAGQLNCANSSYVLRCLELATAACVEKKFHALVTGPVHKAIINEAGFNFSGHTEFLAKLTHTPRTVMMLANTTLRVALVTTHLPLREVAEAITPEILKECIYILNQALIHTFQITQPRILVCGLNPHAGEQGHLGNEEQDIIIPVLTQLRSEGLKLMGPVPADTAFTPHLLKQCDAVLTMYHDQGLPVIKAQGFGETVNITLGLPIIRTSVDHGTALELAGSGRADPSSLLAALVMARK